MTDLKQIHQRPEGALIERALAGPPKVSMRELARRIGMSDARVRQIVNGYASQNGQILEVVGPPDTIARMAQAIGVSAEEMSEAGREDVATAMSGLRTMGIQPDGKLWMRQDSAPEIQALREWLAMPESDRPKTPPIGALSLWSWEHLLAAARARMQDDVELLQFTVDFLSRKLYDQRIGGDGNDQDDDGRGAAPNTSPGSDDGPGSVAANLPTIGQRPRRVGKQMPRAARSEDEK